MKRGYYIGLVFWIAFAGVIYGQQTIPRPVLPKKVATTKSQEQINLASISSPVVSAITETSATLTAHVTSSGNGTVSERGICYSTTANPTINNLTLRSGRGTGSFSVQLTDLREGTGYYVRAYAMNEKGTAYSSEVRFRSATNQQPVETKKTEPIPQVTSPPQITSPIEMIYVAGGTFTMGCTGEQGSDCYGDEKPAHQVTLSAYYIGKYPVTQKEWRAVMGDNPSYFKGDNLPVEKVSWHDAQEFVQRLSAQTGKTYRLPTEAEWEFAARGGTKSAGYKYSGSNTLDRVAWYGDNSESKTQPVGQKLPNELGLYDMSGNVLEWCSDRYGNYNSNTQRNPKGPASGSDRVLRGGSWFYAPRNCRSSNRNFSTSGSRSSDYGFRVVLVP